MIIQPMVNILGGVWFPIRIEIGIGIEIRMAKSSEVFDL